ncbi:MAG TPA: hypothetical protein VFC16_04450 [Nakamurella sp.]|nr:hypothetical protein [Nakamurella sp.]
MLHVDRDRYAASAWALAGFPSGLLPAVESADHLWWALTELAAAADAADSDAVTDLAAVVGVVADLLLTHGSRSGSGQVMDPVAISVVLELWGDLQRAVGAQHLDVVALHAVTMRRLVPEPRSRTANAVPVYVPPAQRMGSAGHVPLVITGEEPADPADPAAAVLTGIARMLLTGRGHLADRHSTWCPPGCTPPRVGWLASRQPRGRRLGVISLADAAVVLDPPVVVDLLAAIGVRAGSIDRIGRLLGDRWLMDSTLVVADGRVRRVLGVAGAAEDGEPAGWTWRLSTRLWDSDQFTSGPETVAPLHLVPNTDA